jgi:hypothetical protein
MDGTRRGFLKGFGLLGAVVAGAASYQITVKEQEKEKEDISHLAPLGRNTIAFTADNEPEVPQKITTITTPSGQTYSVSMGSFSNPVPTHQVNMSVGKDNRLWMRVEDKWYRVALET